MTEREWRTLADERGRTVHQLDDKVERLRDEIARLRGLLKRLEWAGELPCYQDESCGATSCPVCDAPEGFPHGIDNLGRPCWLAAELAQNDEDAPPRP